MSRLPNFFFAFAALYILIGVHWGLYMAITHDFATAPGHAHLNLIGWASMAIMGAFYATLGRETPRKLMAANLVLSNIGVIGMVSALALLLSDTADNKTVAPLFAIGALSVIGGFFCFGAAVVRTLWKPAPRMDFAPMLAE